MKNLFLSSTLISLLLFASMPAFSQVEQVTGLTVNNVPAMIATMEQYGKSGESKARSVSLMRNMHDGGDPSTHTIVGLFDNLEDLEANNDSHANSEAWGTFRRSAAGNATVNGSFLALQRRNWGDAFWKEGDYVVAVAIQARDGDFLKVMDEMMSTSEVKIPGMIRVMRLRGNPVGTHAVLISASSYADLINFQESIEASAPMATMRAANASTPAGATYYKVDKVWNK